MEKKINKLIKEKNFKEISNILEKENLTNIIKILGTLYYYDILEICNLLDLNLLAKILEELNLNLTQRLLEDLDDKIIDELSIKFSTNRIIALSDYLPNNLIVLLTSDQKIEELIENKDYSSLKKLLSKINENDLARILERLPEAHLGKIFRLLPKELASYTFVELDYPTQENLINNLSNKELSAVIDELFLDDIADILEEMPANVVKRILAQSDPDTRKAINQILKYPSDSAGSIMTVELVKLKSQMTVQEAFDKIRKTAIDKETIYTCYITDNSNKLIGYISAKELLIADKETKLENIMHYNVIYSHTHEDKEEVARKISDYNFLAMPIVDDERRLVGIVTVDDAIDVITEEASEDISKMAAITPTNKAYLKTSVWEIWKNRMPWLLLLMISSTFTGLIINNFESRLSAISPILFACVPMIMGTGGNAGAQVSVTVIRSLAMNEISQKDWLKAIWKELRVSIILGITLGIACYAKLTLLDCLVFGIADYTPIRCLIISIALTITIVMSKLVGCILPILAKKLHLDPAVVANPFITTIIDIVSLVIYCVLAISILS